MLENKCEGSAEGWKGEKQHSVKTTAFLDPLLLHSCMRNFFKETTVERRAGGRAEGKYFRQPI